MRIPLRTPPRIPPTLRPLQPEEGAEDTLEEGGTPVGAGCAMGRCTDIYMYTHAPMLSTTKTPACSVWVMVLAG